ncbi:MAG: TerB family tellurite resistance protein [Oscillochloris sp.]|nr:TerB family tellurite resistance protein [Oscillochloris sp.]
MSADDLVQIAALPEHQRVAYAGALYALAVADGALDKEELQLISELVDPGGLSSAGRDLMRSYVLTPPTLADTLAAFGAAPETVRYALMLNLLEIAWANDLLTPQQDSLLTTARSALAINEDQYRALWRFVRELRAVRLRGQNDNAAAQATRVAAAGLAAVGVPLAAMYVSGSVIGLSAAGITSGLAALGLGLGMVPGIGVAVLLGTAVFVGVHALLDAGRSSEPGQLQRQLIRRSHETIADLEAMIAMLDQAIGAIDRNGGDLASGLRLGILYERRRALEQILARRRALLTAIAQ